MAEESISGVNSSIVRETPSDTREELERRRHVLTSPDVWPGWRVYQRRHRCVCSRSRQLQI